MGSQRLGIRAGWAFAFLAATAFAQEVAFKSGDVARLGCRVTKAQEVTKGSNSFLLTVEVSNPLALCAEPVEFEVAPIAGGGMTFEARALRRFAGTVIGRAGRAVPPGGKLSYWVMVSAPAGQSAALRLRVSKASFFTGPPVRDPPVRAGPLTFGRFRGSDDASRTSTIVPLENLRDEPVDVILLATTDKPRASTVLLRRRLEPKEKAKWEVQGVRYTDDESSGEVEGAELDSVKVVDWSAIRDEGREAAASLFRTAYDAWLRWPEGFPGFRARFSFGCEPGAASSAKKGIHAEGTVSVDAAGRIRVAGEPALDSDAAGRVEAVLRDALEFVRRKPATEIVSGLAPALIDVGLVGLDAGEWFKAIPKNVPTLVRIEDGRIREIGMDGGIRCVFTTSLEGTGYVVAGCATEQRALKGSVDTLSLGWVMCEGAPVPVKCEKTYRIGLEGAPERQVLSLTEIAAAGPAAAPPVAASPEAETVRRAWEAPYRYPEQPVTLSGRFAMDGNLSDGVWAGQRKVAGTFRLPAFTGMRGDGRRWGKAEFQLDDIRNQNVAEAVISAVEDRFRMWAFRDFAGRESFETHFRGARFTAAAGSPGTFDVEGGPCRRIVIEDGAIHAILGGRTPAADRADMRYGYTRLAGKPVATISASGEEECSAVFTEVAPGWLVPTRMRFERVFGRDWGPEVLIFSDLKLER